MKKSNTDTITHKFFHKIEEVGTLPESYHETI